MLPDSLLRRLPQTVLSTIAGPDGNAAFNNFYTSSAASMNFPAGTDVSNRTSQHISFRAAKSAIETQIVANLTTQAATNVINCANIQVASIPTINLSGRSDMKLWTLIGGTQGVEVELTNIQIIPSSRGFIANIRFKLCDDFGVDISDLSRSGPTGGILNRLLLPFWILQHRRKSHTPLVMNIEVDDIIAGTF